jgi:hypothetical protein
MGRFLKDFFLWILLTVFGRNIKLARSWNELSELQLKEIAFSLEWYHRKKKESKNTQIYLYSKLYLSLIKQLLRTNNPVKVWIALRQIPPSEYNRHTNYLIGENTRTKFLPAFTIGSHIYYPPHDRLQNLTIKEFSFADSMFYQWRKSGDIRFLDLLCATLYRKGSFKYPVLKTPKNDLDIRKKFDKIYVQKDVQHFKTVDHKKKLAIAYCYEGSRNYIINQYPHVFPKPIKVQEDKNQVKKEASYTPFGKLIHFKIQFDISKLESAQNLNVHDFFGPYENELIELKKQK